MKVFLYILIFISLTGLVKAEEDKNNDNDFPIDTTVYVNLYNNSINICYSTISGFGLGYGRRIFDNYQVELVGFLHYNEYQKWNNIAKDSIIEDNKDILYDFGLEIQRDIFKSRTSKFYAMLGLYYAVASNNNEQSTIGLPNNTDENKFAVGLGFGFQFFLSQYFATNFHLGYKFERLDKTENFKPSKNISTEVGFGLGISVFL